MAGRRVYPASADPFACGAAGTPLPYPLRAFPDPLREAPFSFQLFSFQLFSSAGTPLPYPLRAFPDPLREAPFSFQLFSFPLFSSAGTPLPYPRFASFPEPFSSRFLPHPQYQPSHFVLPKTILSLFRLPLIGKPGILQPFCDASQEVVCLPVVDPPSRASRPAAFLA